MAFFIQLKRTTCCVDHITTSVQAKTDSKSEFGWLRYRRNCFWPLLFKSIVWLDVADVADDICFWIPLLPMEWVRSNPTWLQHEPKTIVSKKELQATLKCVLPPSCWSCSGKESRQCMVTWQRQLALQPSLPPSLVSLSAETEFWKHLFFSFFSLFFLFFFFVFRISLADLAHLRSYKRSLLHGLANPPFPIWFEFC